MAERRYKFDLKSADLKEAPQAWVLGRSSYRIRRSHKGHPETSSRQAKDAAEELITGEFIKKKQTGYGLHVSLNPQKKADIDNLIRGVLKE